MTTPANNTILQTADLHKSYRVGSAEQQVLRGVNLNVARGEFVAVMGASGSGKSTLLHILGLLDRPDQGRVIFNGQDIHKISASRQDKIRNREFGFVFQFYHLLPELDVRENIMLPLMVGNSLWSWLARRRSARQQADAIMTAVGITAQARQKPNTLSGGQRQRAAIARALVHQPRLLLADEPTGNLDSATGREILDVFHQLNRDGQTIIMVTHDADIAELAHRKLVLQDGQIR